MNLAELSIKRPIFISCIVLLMLVLGVVSLKKMSVDLFPDVTFPILSIQVLYPGASPVDMEKLVAKPIEDELGGLSGLNKLTSMNSESVSVILLEYKIGTDIKDAETQVRQRIQNIRRNLPSDIKDPIIRRFDPADQPIARIAVGSSLPSDKLFDLVEDQIKPQFETLAGVGQVAIAGGRKKEIQVLINQQKLQDLNLSVLQVADRIKNTSKDVPVGKYESSTQEVVYRASGEFENVASLQKVNVNFLGSDQAIKLGTFAQIKEGLQDQTSITSLMTKANSFHRIPTVYLDVYKQSGSNTVKVVELIEKQIPKTNQFLKDRGDSVNLEMVRESARPIKLNIADVREAIIIGIILCIVVVFFFLGSVRSTFITGMALPNSLLGGFVLMYAMGFSINIMTLLALTLAVGLLIDDAIVVRENIFRYLEKGFSPKDAALKGTQEVSLAVIATTLVVIAVFGPIAFLDGIIGQFFKQFGLTIVFTMLISLFDAFTVAPMLSAYMATAHETKRGNSFIDRMLGAFDRFQTGLEQKYVSLLKWVLDHRLTTIGLAFAFFVGCLGLTAFVPKNFLPPQDNGEFIVSLEKPVGTAIQVTEKLTRKIEDDLKSLSQIELLSTVIGSSSGVNEPNKASIYIKLVPKKFRAENTTKTKELVRRITEKYNDEALIAVGDFDISGGNQKIFNFNVTSEDLTQLSTYVDKLKARLQKIPGLTDVDTNYRSGKPEFHIEFDRNQAESLGVSTVGAGSELRGRVEGIVASTFRNNGKEYDIRVRLEEEGRNLKKNFNEILIPNVNFNMIPLRKVAKGEDTLGYSQINRQNKARYINISANLGSKGNLGNITTEVERIIASEPEFKMPVGMDYRFQGQAQDFQDLLANMLVAMFLGVLFIYLVLSSLYESFMTPLTILLALPLAICGAIIALLITQKSLDIFSLIGFVLLLGVVAKNSILVVDYTVHLIRDGLPRREALLKACETRLRPILMTSLALIAGTVPIAIGLNEASAQRTSMGVAIIGGLMSSTVLTLVVVPAAFGYIDDLRAFLGRWFSKLSGSSKP